MKDGDHEGRTGHAAAWLTRITPDLRRREVRRDLADAVALHKRVMTLVPDELGADARSLAGVLFRVEQTRAGAQILVQTQLEPTPERLPGGYGQTATRKLTPMLDELRPGAAVRYRIAANPSKRLGRDADHPGKVSALRGAEADDWWAARAAGCGLAVRTVSTLPLDDLTGRRAGGGRVRHALTRYDGLAVVTEPDALRRAVLDGVGRGKSYGAGLLSLAPLRTAA